MSTRQDEQAQGLSGRFKIEKKERKVGAHIFLACANVLAMWLLYHTYGQFKALFNGMNESIEVVKFSTYGCFSTVLLLGPAVYAYLIAHQLKPDYWIKRAHAVNKFCVVALIVTFSSGFVVAPLMSKAVTDRNYIRCPKLDNVGTTYKYYTRDMQTCIDQVEAKTQKSLSAR